jgi:hypothetical protein
VVKLRLKDPSEQYMALVPGSELAASEKVRVNCCSRRTPICEVAVTAPPPGAPAPVAVPAQTPKSALTNVDDPICLLAPIRVLVKAVARLPVWPAA